MELKIGLKKRKPISTHFFSNFINDLSTVEVNYHYTPVISGLSVTFISNVGVILIHFYGRRAFRSNGLDSRLLSMRANRMPRVIERAWLLKGVTETGSAPQVPGYRWIHLSFPLFHPFVISLTPSLSLPPSSCLSSRSFLSHQLEQFPSSQHSSLRSIPFVDRSLRIYHVYRTLDLASHFRVSPSKGIEEGRAKRRKGEKERQREGIMGSGSVCREMICPERACN